MSSKVRPVVVKMFDLTRGGHEAPDMTGFAKALTEFEGPILGLDVGLRHIGVSMSDANRQIAFAQRGFRRASIRQDIEIITGIMKLTTVQAAVVGLPTEQVAPSARKLPDFIRMYSRGVLPECGIRVIGFWDESLSTKLAKDAFMQRTRKRLRNRLSLRKRMVDAVSSYKIRTSFSLRLNSGANRESVISIPFAFIGDLQ